MTVFLNKSETVKRFTHVDPFEDTESCESISARMLPTGFTHVDPFEDTERPAGSSLPQLA